MPGRPKETRTFHLIFKSSRAATAVPPFELATLPRFPVDHIPKGSLVHIYTIVPGVTWDDAIGREIFRSDDEKHKANT